MHAESARIVLASGSPRREELLRRVAREFEIAPSGFEEPAHGRPIARALAAARGKAHDAARQRDAIVIGADTLVVVGRAVLGKPRSRDDARAMLGRLSGRCHTVVTGLCVLDTRRSIERSAVEKTRVHFRPLSPREIDDYLDAGEYEDKAGAYGIQGRAAIFIDWIRGDYTNVMGLPVARLALLLRELGAGV